MKYRVENKYIITADQIEYLKYRLLEVMEADSNMENESYLIKSLYFDDLYNSCMLDNENGNNEREKFRIRTYNNSKSIIKLELKGKKNGYTSKDSVLISEDILNQCLKGGTNPMSNGIAEIDINSETPYLLKKLWLKNRLSLLSPVCIVEYERLALTNPKGNVRITFDKNIGVQENIHMFLEDRTDAVPVLPAGQHILEVKYDEFLPDYIKSILDTGTFIKTAFSKYYYSRRTINELSGCN